MGLVYSVDANVLIGIASKRLPTDQKEAIDFLISKGQVGVSIITYIEAFSKIGIPIKEFIALHAYFNLVTELPLKSEIAQQTIEFRKHSKRKLPDCIVAATAF